MVEEKSVLDFIDFVSFRFMVFWLFVFWTCPIIDFLLGSTDEEGHNWIRRTLKKISLVSAIMSIVGILWFAWDATKFLINFTGENENIEAGAGGLHSGALADTKSGVVKESSGQKKYRRRRAEESKPYAEKTSLRKLKDAMLIMQMEGDKAVHNLGKFTSITLRRYLVIADALETIIDDIPDIKISEIKNPKFGEISVELGSVEWNSIYNKLKKSAEEAAAKAAKAAAKAAKKAAKKAASAAKKAAKKAKFW